MLQCTSGTDATARKSMKSPKTSTNTPPNHKYATEQGIAEEEALKKGWKKVPRVHRERQRALREGVNRAREQSRSFPLHVHFAKNKHMKTLDENLLETATQGLVAEFQPEQVWLYGSHAWGNPHDDSDVDLLVVLRDSDETPIRRAQRAHRCLRGLRMPKDVLVETRQEVDRVKGLKTSLENIILSRGRRLYG